MMERILEAEVMDTWEDAVEYDSMDFTDVNSAFAKRSLELGPPHGLLLDAGTGTARIPILIAKRKLGLQIIGIDLSKNMLLFGSKNVENANLISRIVLQLIDAKDLPFDAAHFDMVISNSIIHHLPDPIPFLIEVKRVLKPNGALLIRDLIRPPDVETMNALVERVCVNYDEHQTMLFRDSLQASLSLNEVEKIAVEAGIEGTRIYQSSDRHWTMERPWKANA